MLTKYIFSRPQLTKAVFSAQRVATFSEENRSRLFGNNKKFAEIRKRIQREEDPNNRYEADATRFKVNQNQSAGAGIRSELVYSSDLESVLSMFKRIVSQPDINLEENYEFFFACLDRLDILTTEKNSMVGLAETIQILRALSIFRPKEFEQDIKINQAAGKFNKNALQDDYISVRHKELIKEKSDKFVTVPAHMANFVYTNLTKGLFKDMFTDYDEEQKGKTETGLHEVLQAYIQIYQNLEIRVNDQLNGKKLNPKQALDALTSYAIANEGTNTLYLGLVDVVATRNTLEMPYSLTEVEMLLNYFPHALWQDSGNASEQIGPLREKFYFPIIHRINGESGWEEMSNEQFLAIFQGLSLTGPSVFKPEVLNNVLNSFVTRLETLSFDEVIAFYELYVSFLRQAGEKYSELIDINALMQITNEKSFSKVIEDKKLSMYEVTCLYWVYKNVGGWDPHLLNLIEDRVCDLITQEIVVQKQLERQRSEETDDHLQTMHLQDLKTIVQVYDIDPSLQELSTRYKEIKKLILQAEHWDKPEQQRKWFHF